MQRSLPFFLRRSLPPSLHRFLVPSLRPHPLLKVASRLKRLTSAAPSFSRHPYSAIWWRAYWRLRVKRPSFRLSFPVRHLKLKSSRQPLFTVNYSQAPKRERERERARALSKKRKPKAPRHRKRASEDKIKNKKPMSPFLFTKRSYSYLFTLPSLPLWLTQFFYLFFVYHHTLLSSL